MAVTFDAASSMMLANQSTASLAHDVSGNMLVVGLLQEGVSNLLQSLAYGGHEMTISPLGFQSFGLGLGLVQYTLLNPPQGTNNIVPTFSGNVSGGIIGISVFGASGTVGNTGVDHGNSGVLTSTISTVASTGDMVIDFIAVILANTVGTSSQTLRASNATGSTVAIGASTAPGENPTVMKYTRTGSPGAYTMIDLVIQAATKVVLPASPSFYFSGGIRNL